MQTTSRSSKDLGNDSYESKIKAQKKLVEKLKVEWKLLWSESFNDKVRAEDVSVNDYHSLQIERGTIIQANKDYKALNFKEILDQHLIENPERFIQPSADAGGWNKFVKTKIYLSSMQKEKFSMPNAIKKQAAQQPNKGKQGWLHLT